LDNGLKIQYLVGLLVDKTTQVTSRGSRLLKALVEMLAEGQLLA
jgi:hypothetical protein